MKRSINFDDLFDLYDDCNSYYKVPSNYAGFDWIEAGFMLQQHGKIYLNTGFETAFAQNKKCVVFNFGGLPLKIIDPHNTFSIISFEATCGFQDKLTLTVTGRQHEKKVQTKIFILHYQKLQVFTLNWNDIDELEFLPEGGKQLPAASDTDRHVILTSLNFN